MQMELQESGVIQVSHWGDQGSRNFQTSAFFSRRNVLWELYHPDNSWVNILHIDGIMKSNS